MWGLMRKSSLTSRHGVPGGLNSDYGEQPSEPRRPTSAHIVLFCFAVLACILFVECVIASACLVVPAALLLQRWQQLAPFSHAEVRRRFPPSSVEGTL